MNDGISQGVDKQLKFLRTLLSFITDFPTIHSRLLQNGGNTALVGHIRRLGRRGRCRMLLADELESIALPNGTTQVLGPADRDTFPIFEELYLFDNGEHPQFTQLEAYYSQTATNELFRKVCPILAHPKPIPAVVLKSLMFTAFEQFSSRLETEAELIPTVFTKLVNGEADNGELGPGWMWALAMEITNRLCSDAESAHSIRQRYDALATDGCTSSASSARVFTSLISAFRLLVTSRPTLLGVSPPQLTEPESVAEMVTMAASGTGTIGTGAGLSVKTAVIKVQCIDELDKADAPLIPEASVHLLGVQYPVSFSNGLTVILSLYNTLAVQKTTRRLRVNRAGGPSAGPQTPTARC
ncbi:hypothetical protein BGY98DRAFT_1101372 [Russula aff. rugulosa BPL654]|nr:hypothetical protein BGY98DRAFT_1101372 [Russula aff. rugulosa BPL654]